MARPKESAKDGARGSPRNFAVAYLNVLIDDADEEELTAALGRLARASGGPKLVEKVELSAPSFYRTLCRRGNPELKSVAALLKAMGIRLALGARPEQVLQLIVRDGLLLGMVGSAIGLAGAYVLSRFLTLLLFGVSTVDPATYAGFTAVLLIAVFGACYRPGLRAARVDPVTSLRHD